MKILEECNPNELEVVIVDDCSTDDSYSQLIQYSKTTPLSVTVIQNDRNSGPGVSRNRGIEKATGEYPKAQS